MPLTVRKKLASLPPFWPTVMLLPVVVSAIRAVPEELVQTARTLGAGRFQVVFTVLMPAAAPDIFDSFRVMNAISWTYVILAEFVNTRSGLGYQIQLAGNHLHIDEVFAGIRHRSIMVEHDDVEEALFNIAEREHADLIALLHRHSGFWDSLRHGSTTKAVALNSTIPVLALEQ